MIIGERKKVNSKTRNVNATRTNTFRKNLSQSSRAKHFHSTLAGINEAVLIKRAKIIITYKQKHCYEF